MEIIRSQDIKANAQTIKSDIASESGKQTYTPVDKKVQEEILLSSFLYRGFTGGIDQRINRRDVLRLITP